MGHMIKNWEKVKVVKSLCDIPIKYHMTQIFFLKFIYSFHIRNTAIWSKINLISHNFSIVNVSSPTTNRWCLMIFIYKGHSINIKKIKWIWLCTS